jgi:protein-S-isoprenylcysteine O-methyltransferase Ste14
MDAVMAAVALGLYVVFLVVAFGIRVMVHRSKTGSAGFRGVSGRPGSVEWWAGVLFVVAVVVGILAPVLQVVGWVSPVLDQLVVQLIGGVVAVIGIVVTVVAQQAMGNSWRVGVDPDEVTGLVTAGPFGTVRNPIFTAMITATAGLVLVAPNVVALAGLLILVVAVELQVRMVEEPYLARVHGESYREYGHHAGRFLPGVGRFSGAHASD